MIECLKSVTHATAYFRGLSKAGSSIGFVPTMGDLHEGHLSLIRRARQENDYVAVSVFVNPTQFDDINDFTAYQQPLEADIHHAGAAGADIVFVPQNEDLYVDDYSFRISECNLSQELEGAHRRGHFDGVLTVVMKLLNIVRPTRAYFGEKDWQQLQLVQRMAAAFFLETSIVACPTVRESDGLAMSSRNKRLSERERALAPFLYKTLRSQIDEEEMAVFLRQKGIEVDYIERRGRRLLGAVKIGSTRLIDNVES